MEELDIKELRKLLVMVSSILEAAEKGARTGINLDANMVCAALQPYKQMIGKIIGVKGWWETDESSN